jgi:aspartyl-tRNA(Asn)/glutamyl-tRNA(Gln) amidotransferase subunit B
MVVSNAHADSEKELIRHLRATLPMMPDELLDVLTNDPKYGLTAKDAKTLISFEDGDRLEYYFDVVDVIQIDIASGSPQSIGRVVGNW